MFYAAIEDNKIALKKIVKTLDDMIIVFKDQLKQIAECDKRSPEQMILNL